MVTEHFHSIPRDAWSAHPHWPDQVLLLRSHRNFRAISRELVEAARIGEELRWVGLRYAGWISAMRSHEAYEEHKLYPYLARRWSLSFESAAAGHRRLHERDQAVRQALLPGPGPALARALEEHDLALQQHLDHEEELVIPALLQLRPQEFDEYLVLGVHELLRRLEGAAPGDSSA